MENEKSRVRYLDIARGICMISIVLGHLGNSSINRIVFTYHIPIFYLIAGYFSKKESIPDYLKHKAKTVLVPYYISAALVMLS